MLRYRLTAVVIILVFFKEVSVTGAPSPNLNNPASSFSETNPVLDNDHSLGEGFELVPIGRREIIAELTHKNHPTRVHLWHFGSKASRRAFSLRKKKVCEGKDLVHVAIDDRTHSAKIRRFLKSQHFKGKMYLYNEFPLSGDDRNFWGDRFPRAYVFLNGRLRQLSNKVLYSCDSVFLKERL